MQPHRRSAQWKRLWWMLAAITPVALLAMVSAAIAVLSPLEASEAEPDQLLTLDRRELERHDPTLATAYSDHRSLCASPPLSAATPEELPLLSASTVAAAPEPLIEVEGFGSEGGSSGPAPRPSHAEQVESGPEDAPPVVQPAYRSRTKEERLAQLKEARERQSTAADEIETLIEAIASVLSPTEASSAIDAVRANPHEYKTSNRPVFRKLAAALVTHTDATARMESLELELRDMELAPVDLMTDVRALMRAQRAEMDKLRAEYREEREARQAEMDALKQLARESDELKQRVNQLEQVVRAIISLPQISICHDDVRPIDLLSYASALGMHEVMDAVLCCEPVTPNVRGQVRLDLQRAWMDAATQAGVKIVDGAAPLFEHILDIGRVVFVYNPCLTTTHDFARFQAEASLDGRAWTNATHQWPDPRLARFFKVKLLYVTNVAALQEKSYCSAVVADHGVSERLSSLRLPVHLPRGYMHPLHLAARNGDPNAVAKLLDHGANVDAVAGMNPSRSALHFAAAAASLPVVELLVKSGAKIHNEEFSVPLGPDGDLVAGFLRTRGSKSVLRTA